MGSVSSRAAAGIAQAEQKFANSFDRLAESQKLIRRQADRGPG
jgi:hypothetical protein